MPNPAELFSQYMTTALEGGDMEEQPDTTTRTVKESAVDFLNHLIDTTRKDF